MDGEETSFSGGLYPNGSNQRPITHNSFGISIGNEIVPLGTDGQPDPEGHIVMISVGMSNAAQEFRDFVNLTKDDSEINPSLAVVNGAQPGMVSGYWVDPNAETWDEIERRLNSGGLTPEQVQIAWVKNTQTGSGDFPEKIQSIQADLEQISRNLKVRYPNIKLAYFSSRTRSYTYWDGLSPEPTAFETGFAVKWMIEKQIMGDTELNYNPSNGDVMAPYLSWGPYLWADGINTRSDGLVWTQQDMAPDCTHPSDQGSAKIANMLMEFFKTDDTSKSWFLGESAIYPTQIPTPTTEEFKAFIPLNLANWFDDLISSWNSIIENIKIPN
jgi:hypothetical protein